MHACMGGVLGWLDGLWIGLTGFAHGAFGLARWSWRLDATLCCVFSVLILPFFFFFFSSLKYRTVLFILPMTLLDHNVMSKYGLLCGLVLLREVCRRILRGRWEEGVDRVEWGLRGQNRVVGL